jgi:hypothetical protein
MSIKELFVKRVPLFDRDDVVHNHVGLELSKIIQRLNLGKFYWNIYPLEKSRCIIGTQPNDGNVDTTGLLVFEEEGSALVMARQLVEINYSTVKDGKTFHHVRTLKFRVNRINGRLVTQIKPLEGKLIYFNYEVGQTLNGEVLNWNGDKFAFKVDEAAFIEKVGVETWANGDFQSYCENSRAFVVNGRVGQKVIAKLSGKWQRSEIIQIISPVDYIVESKETLEKQQLIVHEIKVLSLELSMIRLSTIKCKLDKITIEIDKRDTFKEWRSSIIGRMSITIKKFENEIYHVELYRNITLMNLVALMILTKK